MVAVCSGTGLYKSREHIYLQQFLTHDLSLLQLLFPLQKSSTAVRLQELLLRWAEEDPLPVVLLRKFQPQVGMPRTIYLLYVTEFPNASTLFNLRDP
jgi:hypothetical protein